MLAALMSLAAAFQSFAIEPLPQTVAGCEIDNDVRNEANRLLSTGQRCAYLVSIVTNATNLTATDNLRKASAIRLLGAIGDTSSIVVLVLNINFKDIKHLNHPYPALSAIITFGDEAIPQLLEILKEKPGNPKRNSSAVEAMRSIKGSKYNEFVLSQKNKLSPEIWEKLYVYAIDD